MTDETIDARAQLRAALGCGTPADPGIERFLDGLPWRVRQAVVLVYREGCTRDQAGRRLSIHPETVGRYLRIAYECWLARSAEN